MTATMVATSWHQNSGREETEIEINSVLTSTSAEELESCLLAIQDENESPVYAKYCSEKLHLLAELIGLPASLPAPDEVDVEVASRALFSHSRPEYHTTMALEIALVRLGCVTVEVAS